LVFEALTNQLFYVYQPRAASKNSLKQHFIHLTRRYLQEMPARRTVTTLLSIGLVSLTLGLSGCDINNGGSPSKAEITLRESSRINAWFEDRYQDRLARSPMNQTYLGQRTHYDRLDDSSALARDEDAALTEAWLKEMRAAFDYDKLDDTSKLSYRLYEFESKDSLDMHSFADHDYIFQHMNGPHSDLPSFLINFHVVKTEQDAKAYIARLSQTPDYLSGFIQQADEQFNNNIRLPAFAYPKISEAARNVITGAPFTNEPDSPLFADIKAKIDSLSIDPGRKKLLIAEARAALLSDFQPAYLELINMFSRHAASASEDDGAWKLPRGEAYYNARLKHYTTTKLTADEIHDIGLKEVERIQTEMREIMLSTGFEGDLQAFFKFLRTDKQFTFENTDEGRAAYMDRADLLIDEMKIMLDQLFIAKPKADIIVKRVEPFREDTAFGAFYDQPALDGSRPGTYYINLRDMNELPIYQLQALAYHEGIPGHHMQIAIGMELEGLPKFRTLGGHTSYIEGWALYAESVPADLGLYTDAYQDFGRLSMEIFRAARLVVDTGIHAKKWTRTEAVAYMMENTANSEGDIRAEIDRYIVWPGQATAYKIGMLKITELKARAEKELGDKFEIREFHDVILANGSVPLSILEELVDDWIMDVKQKDK